METGSYSDIHKEEKTSLTVAKRNIKRSIPSPGTNGLGIAIFCIFNELCPLTFDVYTQQHYLCY